MAIGWIKIESVTPEKIEVFRIAKILGADRDLVLGKLVKLWIWADQHTTDGSLSGIDAGDINLILDFPGFAEALREVGWLESGDGGVCIVNFQKQNGQSAKARALSCNRTAKSRAKAPDKAKKKN